jgi:hypothetical protein
MRTKHISKVNVTQLKLADGRTIPAANYGIAEEKKEKLQLNDDETKTIATIRVIFYKYMLC